MIARVSDATSSGRRRNPLIRLFSSITFGVVLLTLILIYASVMSALPQVRGVLEMTEMEVFRHWTFCALIALFATVLTVATLVRIRFNWINAGVLTVHSGLLLLAGGSAWYFATKVEGDVILISPRIELLADGRKVRDAQALAESGRSWQQTMPALGGRVRFDVLATDAGDQQAPTAARVRVFVGDEPPKDIDVLAGRTEPINSKLAIRFTSFPPQTAFFDDEMPALAYRTLDEGASGASFRFAPIPGLPMHRERYLDEGYVLRDSQGRAAPSKRVTPAIAIGGVTIPTGWFEHWRMPIQVDAADLPFDVRVTGYLPYVAGTETVAAGGGGKENPAIDVTFSDGRSSLRESLFAFEPAGALLDTEVPIEFRWFATPQEREAAFRPLAGPHELDIELIDPPFRQTLAVSQGQKIEIPGTSYVLTVTQLSPAWPLMSPGFEGAMSPMASVDVVSEGKSYNRTVIQRYPQLSQDIDEQGMRRREGPYDPNLVLRYRTSANGWVMLAAGPDQPTEVATFDPSGDVRRAVLESGKAVPATMRGAAVQVTLNAFFRDGQKSTRPVIEPIETRRPNMGRQLSAVRVELRGRGEHADWRESHWVTFNMYPHVDARSLIVRPPGSPSYEVLVTRMQRDLGVALTPGKLSVKVFPGTESPESWRSDFYIAPLDGGVARADSVQTNDTTAAGSWTLYQSGAATDRWSYTILGVGNREGILAMNVGWIAVTIGAMYAFYIKPVLLKRRKEAGAKARRRVAAEDESASEPRPQIGSEVGARS